MVNNEMIYRHFSRVSDTYRDIRTTDRRPIFLIRKDLEGLSTIKAADVGCGAGRYDRKLFSSLGKRLFIFCIDENKKMLLQLRRYLTMCNLRQFYTIRAIGGSIPLSTNSLDCVFTFNAVHHFTLPMFLKESARVLKSNGYFFIYTRLRNQNRNNIWGRYFPGFYEKEKRLYYLEELKSAITEVSSLELQAIRYFKFRRLSNLTLLKEQAKKHHYSTFCFYEKKELDEALQKFEENIKKKFPDPQRITWIDENTMFTIRKESD
ncbi:MAG: class I SAM-dependent methyltransferase [bacterium]|nr:class I SAM-dependent methyltransferase [bacterium]